MARLKMALPVRVTEESSEVQVDNVDKDADDVDKSVMVVGAEGHPTGDSEDSVGEDIVDSVLQ
jgi:hypothetical protein